MHIFARKESSVESRFSLLKFILFTLLLPAALLAFVFFSPYDSVIAPFSERPQLVNIDDLPEEVDPASETDYIEEMPIEPFGYGDVEGFVTVHMSASDIHTGTMLLINSRHAFDLAFLPELVVIAEERTTSATRVQDSTFMVAGVLMEPLDAMMDAFVTATGDRTVAITSAFRTHEVQSDILQQLTNAFGATRARQMAMRPGHSEHNAGLAVDFAFLTGGVRRQFGGRQAAWFANNAHRFGFILRYPPGRMYITGVIYEPWHYRYVGNPHATIMFDNDWVMEEYIDMLRSHCVENPFVAVVGDVTYELFFTSEMSVLIPFNTYFEIEGNNVDGFIVTLTRFETPEDTDHEV